ncbi:MAG TPA: phytanoyl-CoA dioxygenase family protein [Pyrinomonadaceae bacterium]|nr:phytanoyl-CoA dioxygenase family protein [Pyrinomonadaceae bacterium]
MESFERDGYVLVPDCFSAAEVELMKGELPALFSENSPRRVAEVGGRVVRSVYGSHATNDVFRRVSRHPLLVEAARQLLDSEVYIYQFKINAKAAFDGDVWEWHQDFIFWLKEDGMPAARVVNTAIFLDDITEFNGPMFLIPGSHHEGVVASRTAEEPQPAYSDSPDWINNLTAKIRYSVGHAEVERLATKYGLAAPKGRRGSVLFFDSNLVHASPANISPFNRAIVFITYNSVENVPTLGEDARPDFLVSRDSEPLVPFETEALLSSHDGGPRG